jgi:hypothetical protein
LLASDGFSFSTEAAGPKRWYRDDGPTLAARPVSCVQYAATTPS